MKARSFVVVIPARLESERLPGKPLLQLAGLPLIEHCRRRAVLAAGADSVWVATHNDEIAEAVQAFGGRVAMTASGHSSGTERIAEVAATQGWDDGTVVVNLQGDEPLMPPSWIEQVAKSLQADAEASMATVCRKFADAAEWRQPHAVKVVCDAAGYALYFSRAAIPHGQELPRAARLHLGLYAYRPSLLARWHELPPAEIERQERLEQLRALAAGVRIRVDEVEGGQVGGVDTAMDLARLERVCAESPSLIADILSLGP